MHEVKVFLVDESEISIIGLKHIISLYSDLQVIGEAYTIADAKVFLETNTPDIIVLDICMGDEHCGIDFAAFLHRKYSSLPVVVLTHHKNVTYIVKSLKVHVRAFMGKDTKSKDIINIILSVVGGKGLFFGNTIPYSKLLQAFGSESNLQRCKPYELTLREIDIINKLAGGLSSKEIAQQLNIDRNTVESYKDRIKAKLGVDSVVEMVVFALKNGIIS